MMAIINVLTKEIQQITISNVYSTFSKLQILCEENLHVNFVWVNT